MSMRKTALAPGQLFRSVHMKKSYPGGLPGGLPGVVSYRRQTMHRGKVDPGGSELPRGNELSRHHVNRPQMLCKRKT